MFSQPLEDVLSSLFPGKECVFIIDMIDFIHFIVLKLLWNYTNLIFICSVIFSNGSSINDVTLFWTIFDPSASPHHHAFITKALVLPSQNPWLPRSLKNDHKCKHIMFPVFSWTVFVVKRRRLSKDGFGQWESSLHGNVWLGPLQVQKLNDPQNYKYFCFELIM